MSSAIPPNSIITVGNFDGLHAGHRALLTAAREHTDREDARLVVLTFAAHPNTVIDPERVPPVLMDIEQRREALLEAGADEVVMLDPSPETLDLAPRQFVERIADAYRPIGWYEGPDFRFGSQRAGTLDTLRELGDELGFGVNIIDPVEVTLRDKTVARVRSSLIRWLVAHGRVVDAHLCLTRPYAVRGPVVQGEKRGRTIGFPTANLDTGNRALPADGVYAGVTRLGDRLIPTAISIGTKPTFDGQQRTFEAFLLDFDESLYGKTLHVDVFRWIRDQARFPGVDALKHQLDRDIQRIRELDAQGLLNPALTASPSTS
ncbi:MAG: riboflavin biosynthesis protein RibF [Planctomycetota bacterium]|jgi:riboflavin kinase/FMN adenylyltransferase